MTDVHEAEDSSQTEAKQVFIHDIQRYLSGKWTLLVIGRLSDRETRFSHLRKTIDGISRKMLTQTLRQLERDGLVERIIYPEVPPRVTYKLTPIGLGLRDSLLGVWRWMEKHMEDVIQARREFDDKHRPKTQNLK